MVAGVEPEHTLKQMPLQNFIAVDVPPGVGLKARQRQQVHGAAADLPLSHGATAGEGGGPLIVMATLLQQLCPQGLTRD